MQDVTRSTARDGQDSGIAVDVSASLAVGADYWSTGPGTQPRHPQHADGGSREGAEVVQVYVSDGWL